VTGAGTMLQRRRKTALQVAIGGAVASVVFAATAAASAGRVDADLSWASAKDVYVNLYSRHSRVLVVYVDFEYRCDDGRYAVDAVWHEGLASGGIAQLRLPTLCTLTHARILRVRWELTQLERSRDANEAYLKDVERRRSEAEQAERERKASCGMDKDGRYRDDDVAYGKIPSACYRWYPYLNGVAQRLRQQESARSTREVQRRLDEVMEERARAAEQARIKAGMDALRAQESAEIEASRAAQRERQRRAEAADARSQQEIDDMQRTADRYRGDPCAGRMALRGMSPDLSSTVQGGRADLLARKQRDWEQQLDVLDRACQREQAAVRQRQAEAAEAERQRRIQAAQAQLDQAVERGQQTVRQQQGETRRQQDDTAALRELLQRP
jgi:hypothetical protein